MTQKTTTFLQHGTGTRGPFRTERVAHKTTRIPKRAFEHTDRDPGQPTSTKVLFAGRWRRVYAEWNSAFFIMFEGARIAVTFYHEEIPA